MTAAANLAERAAQLTPHRLCATATRLGAASAYFVRDEGGWRATSWLTLLEQVRTAARALLALGIEAGDRICILGFNRPEWLILDHAAMMTGATAAGIYWTSAAAEVAFILDHAQARLVLVENAAQAAKIAPGAGPLRHVVAMRGADVPGALAWDEFLALGQGAAAAQRQEEVERRMAALTLDDIGALIYTSGTTGHPKAVMLSHLNLAWSAESLLDAFGTSERDRILSYLPMAHVAERIGSIHCPARGGNAVYFARSMEEILEHLKEVRPTVFFGVPRLWEKMRTALAARIEKAQGAKGALARRALVVGRRWNEAALAGRRPGPLLVLEMALARRLVLRRVRRALGLDAARLLISGAAPIPLEHLQFFLGLDMVVRELYGQSENSGATTVSVHGATRLGAVGKAAAGQEIRVAADGEVLVRAPSVFVGYLRDPEATRETIVEGWLHSGDLGRLDDDGYLYITGRKKDLIITSGGKNIAPASLEADLMGGRLIEHAVVVGEGRHFLAALLTVKEEEARAFAAAQALPMEGLHRQPALLAALQAEVDAVNARHARVANIRKFAVLEGTFSVAAGELTATMKLRRKVVIEANREIVEGFYREG
jgi:long-chain acyl-CoA synthetase